MNKLMKVVVLLGVMFFVMTISVEATYSDITRVPSLENKTDSVYNKMLKIQVTSNNPGTIIVEEKPGGIVNIDLTEGGKHPEGRNFGSKWTLKTAQSHTCVIYLKTGEEKVFIQVTLSGGHLKTYRVRPNFDDIIRLRSDVSGIVSIVISAPNEDAHLRNLKLHLMLDELKEIKDKD